MHKEDRITCELDVDTWRLVPSKFPPIQLFEDILDPADLETAYELESLTNNRLRDQVGNLYQVAPEDRISGPNTSPIMASFTHIDPKGSRFTDGSYGIYYAGLDLKTALKETIYHRSRFLKSTNEEPQKIMMRCYKARAQSIFVDLRAYDDYHCEDYSACQTLGKALRDAGHCGIYYKSVRNPNGECIAALKPKAIQPVVQCGHYEYVWDGSEITAVFKKEAISI